MDTNTLKEDVTLPASIAGKIEKQLWRRLESMFQSMQTTTVFAYPLFADEADLERVLDEAYELEESAAALKYCLKAILDARREQDVQEKAAQDEQD